MAMYPFNQLEEDDSEMMDDAPELPDYGDSIRGIGEYQPAPTKLADLAPAGDKAVAGSTPDQAPKNPLTTQEQLMADYLKLSETSPEELKKARDRDRMLKIGGSIGDALATYLNAQGQMNVKAPGVQVQQGAGLGKVADMFATAPEIQSDTKDRREALLNAYKQLTSAEQDKLDRQLKERQVTAYEDQTKAQAKKFESDESKTLLAKEKEDRLARNAQLNAARGLLKDDPRAKKALEQGMALESIEPLLKEIESGNEMSIQSLGTQLARAMGEVGVLTDTDVIRYVQGTSWGRKLKDWWARGAEGDLPKDAIDGIRKNIKAINKNLSSNLTSVYSNAASRMKTAYPDMDDATIHGLLGTPAFKMEPVKEDKKEQPSNLVKIKGPSGDEATMTEEKAKKYLSKPGYTRIK
jgi:hypothetical protein